MDSVTLNLEDSLNERCGEVFLSFKGNLIFVCTVCDQAYKGFKKFLIHIKDHYYEALDVEKILFSNDDSEIVSIVQTQTETDFDGCDDFIKDIKIERLDNSATHFELVEFDIKQEKETDAISSYSQGAISQIDEDSNISSKVIENFTISKPKEKTKPVRLASSIHSKRRKLPLDSAERKYKCQKCGFGFRDPSNLASHIRRHSDEQKRFECGLCSKRFHSRTELCTHTRSHTKERPYLCTDCGRAFITTSALASHIKRHKNIRESQCPICEKRFYDDGLLRDHMLVHSGERAHKCPHCESSFSRVKALRCHLKLHENKREYQCKICLARFNQKPGLYSHMKSRHKTTPVTSNFLTVVDET